MEVEQYGDDSQNNSGFVDSKQSVNTDNTVERSESDKNLSKETMKRDIIIRTLDGPMQIGEEQSTLKHQKRNDTVCENTVIVADRAREDSDFSSDHEDSSRCQLTNQALRAKLLNSVINPINDKDSKLRVSVFDHRIIPKKLIIPRASDNRNHTDTRDNESENVLTLIHTKSQENINEKNLTNNSGKITALPNPVLTVNRRQSNKQSNLVSTGVENMTNTESDYEIRTRFDILLRNLIGDVDNINVESSPMTVSSGYESDYIQTRNSQKEKLANISQRNTNLNGIKEDPVNDKCEDTVTDYFTMSETYPQTKELETPGAIDNNQFSSLPVFPTQSKEAAPVASMESKEIPIMKSNSPKQPDKEFGFFYAQRQNYKLTKVTRSMYEIIHDLQNGEKVQPDGKKRSRKGRRPGQDSGSDGNNSSKDTLTHGRPQSGEPKSDNNTCNTILKRTKETTNSRISGSVVRCVRRPQCPEFFPRPVHRRFSQSENEGRLGPAGLIDSDKVQNDLRNLLCDTSEVTASSVGINDQLDTFNMSSSNSNTADGFTSAVASTSDNRGNHPKVSINGEENELNESGRKPTLTEQFNNRPKPDDHVYETIPGDEKFYEEWKKMRTSMPRIRRFTTIPDLPGTFIPKEPPALPARKYLNNANQTSMSRKRELSDSNDNYIFMGDINSNILKSDKSDSGYTTVSSDQMLVLREPQCFPYPIGNTSPSDNFGRHDETSDGYCSIDNLSLIREPNDTLSSNEKPKPWRVPEPVSVPPPPRLKRSDFFLNSHQSQFIQNGFSLFNHEHAVEPMVSSEVVDRSFSRDHGGGAALRSSGFGQTSVKQSFQATYV